MRPLLFWEDSCLQCERAIEDADRMGVDVDLVQVRSVDGDPGFRLYGDHEPGNQDDVLLEVRGVPALAADGLCLIGSDCVRSYVALVKAGVIGGEENRAGGGAEGDVEKQGPG